MKKTEKNFKGTGVAVITPFKKSGAIDFESFEKIVDYIISGGVNFIVLLGTTGEATTISRQEKKVLVDYAVGTINNRIPLIVGVGGNNTSDVVQAIHSMPFKGVDGILSVCPYYSKPQQEGIFQHFKVIAEACPVPVILYTVPGRTSSNINASTTLRLATECSNIIGIKEASGNFDQIFQVIKDRPEGFLVLSGDDGLTLPMIAAGADGVISVTANAFPAKVSGMVQAAMKGDFTLARNIHYDLINFTNALFKDGSPSGIKVAMEHKRLCSNYLRLPLVPANPEISRLIIQLCDQLSQ